MKINVTQRFSTYFIEVLTPESKVAKQLCQRIYGKNWATHYHQWELYNTKSGKAQRTNYANTLENL